MVQAGDEAMMNPLVSHLLDLSRPRTMMASVGLVAVLALTFYLRLIYFGQSIDADVGNAAYQAWRLAEGEVLIDLEGPGKPSQACGGAMPACCKALRRSGMGFSPRGALPSDRSPEKISFQNLEISCYNKDVGFPVNLGRGILYE
jgi:hypothetical protein